MFAVRVEYSLPLEKRSRIATGSYSSTIDPSPASRLSVSAFVCSNAWQPGHWKSR